jgi:hypothetical protein
MVGSVATLLVALVFLAIAAWMFRSARMRSRWPTVGGAVTGGRIRQKASGVGDEESVTYVPIVEYQYQISSAVYSGAGIGFSETGYGSVKKAEKILARYAVGTPVEVHYNPAKPGEAFLESSGSIVAWIMLAVGVLILVIAVVLAVYGI